MKKLLLLIAFINLMHLTNSVAQNREIVFGTVTTQNGMPLLGASVFTKVGYSWQGTASDSSGYFELEMSAKDTLYISHIGFKSDTLTFQDLMENNEIVLEETGYTLAESVIIADYPYIKRGCGGSIIKSYNPIQLKIEFTPQVWSYYPNPTVGQLNIETKNTTGIIRLFSSTGVLLQEMPITNDLSNFDLHSFPAGTYFLWYSNKTGWEEPIGKIVKVN